MSSTTVSAPASRFAEHPQSPMLRIRITDAAIEAVRTGNTIKPDYATIAALANVDVDLVREHFPTWDSLVAVAITRWHETRTMPLLAADTSAIEFIQHVVEANAADPRLMRLMISTLATSSDPSDPAAAFYRHQYDSFYRNIRNLLTRDIDAGREPSTMDPFYGAEQLLAIYEGLQLQSMLRDSVDTVTAFARAAARLRRGWSETYHPQRTTDTSDGIYDL